MDKQDAIYEKIEGWDPVIAAVRDHCGPEPHQLIVPYDECALVSFLGEPYAFEACWSAAAGRWIRQQVAQDPAPIPTLRIRINVYVYSEDRLRWWEMDIPTFRQLCDLRRLHGLERNVFCIRNLDEDPIAPRFKIAPAGTIDPSSLASYIEKMPQHDLSSIF